MLSAKQNYKTHDTELLTIVEGSKTWHHYLKRVTHSSLVLTYHKNLKKFLETTGLTGQQTW